MSRGRGILFIVSGPSGVGKGTVLSQVCEDMRDISVNVSVTTRKPREGEINNVHYTFISQEEFDRNVREGNFLEHASFVGNSYGTPKDAVERMRNEGKNVFLEIEVTGATQVLDAVHDDGVAGGIVGAPAGTKTFLIRELLRVFHIDDACGEQVICNVLVEEHIDIGIAMAGILRITNGHI